MKMTRILLAFTMLLAIVFRSLPDSVFDHFHQHEHSSTDLTQGNSVSNYKHNCHIEDWNFESLEAGEVNLQFVSSNNVFYILTSVPSVFHSISIKSTGRAPPVV